jgi:hypothetical protein
MSAERGVVRRRVVMRVRRLIVAGLFASTEKKGSHWVQLGPV